MDQRMKSFLADVLALAGENPDAVREGVRFFDKVFEQAALVRRLAPLDRRSSSTSAALGKNAR